MGSIKKQSHLLMVRNELTAMRVISPSILAGSLETVENP